MSLPTYDSFNLSSAIPGATAFALSCGVGCLVIDPEGDVVYERASHEGHCQFCERLCQLTGKQNDCRQVHLYGCYQAERFGGRYIYFCPAGMAYAASPLMVDDLLVGGLVAGPLLIVDKEDYIVNDIINKNNLSDEYVAEFTQLLSAFAPTTPERMRHLSEMLYITAVYIGGMHQRHMLDKMENERQQQDIGVTIQELKRRGEEPQYPLGLERELLAALTQGDKTRSQQMLNEILGYIYFSSGNQFDLIRKRVLELLVLLSRAVMTGGADSQQVFFLNNRYLAEIDRLHTLEDLSLWLSQVVNRYIRFVFDMTDIKHKDMMFKAVDYMKKNYMKKISLEEVSNLVYLSPSYFSRIFKEELGCTFSAYLNRLRIEKSKTFLLASKREGILDICEMVGFEDQSYFTKVFKRITGVTPAHFREMRGILPSSRKEGENGV